MSKFGMLGLAGATVILVIGLLVPAAARPEVASVDEGAPDAALFSSLLERVLVRDEAGALKLLEAHLAPDADKTELAAQLRALLEVVHQQSDPEIHGYFRMPAGEIAALLVCEAGLRLMTGLDVSGEPPVVNKLITSPGGWQSPPPDPQPPIPGLLEMPDGPTTVAFVNVNVVPMNEPQMARERTVIVRDGKIALIGRSSAVEVPEDGMTIDGTGMYLLPGLTDMHAHLPPPEAGVGAMERTLFLFLAHGVTTVRGMQGHPAHLEWRRHSNAGKIAAPRILTSGPPLHPDAMPDVATAVKLVRHQFNTGFDFLKMPFGAGVAYDVLTSVVDASRELGMPIAGHVWSEMGLSGALSAGYATIDHLDGYIEALAGLRDGFTHEESGFFGFNLIDEADLSKMFVLADETRRSGVWNVPTLSWIEHVLSASDAPEQLASRPEMRFVPEITKSQWMQYTVQRRSGPASDPEQREHYLALRRWIVQQLHDANAGILLGSDAPVSWNVPGFSTHFELELLVQSGLDEYQALTTGTTNVAEFHKTGNWGLIAPNRAADLILLNDNPLENIAHIRNQVGVMRSGIWFPAEEIERRLEKIVSSVANPN